MAKANNTLSADAAPWAPSKGWWSAALIVAACALRAFERLAADRLSNSTAYLIGKALLARENGHLQSFNFDYPPLPMLLVLAWPDERWVALLVGGCHAFLMVLVLYECVRLG